MNLRFPKFFRDNTHIAFALALGLLGSLDYLSYKNATALMENRRAADRSQQIVSALRDYLSAILDIETATRGYVATGNPRFLTPERNAAQRLPVIQAELQRLMDRPEQRRRLMALEPLVTEKIAFQMQILQLRSEKGALAATELVNNGRGQELIEKIRAGLNDIEVQERAQLEAETIAVEKGITQSVRYGWLGDALAFALLFWIYLTLLREISARRRANQELSSQTSLLQSILDNLGDGVIVADEKGRITAFNPAAKLMFGRLQLGVSNIQAARDNEILLPDQITPFPPDKLPLAKALCGEPVDDLELFLQSRNGGMWVRATGRPLLDANGSQQGGVVVCRDITHLKLAHETEIRALNTQLEQRVRELTAANAELESFTYSVSHDLRAPLRQIDGFSRILLEEETTSLSEQGVHYLDRIRSGAGKMGKMVDGLLALARLGRQELRREEVFLPAIVQEVIADLQPEAAGRRIEFKIGPLPVVECDPVLIKNVFINLLSNALKFTAGRDPAVIEVGRKDQNGTTIFFVRDNGVGFDMKYAGKLFGVFQRLHSPDEFAGTGIGLATVQRIVHRHGGDVWAEAEKDRGAAFYFTMSYPGAADAESPTSFRNTKKCESRYG